jgi:RNA polymerase sigma-70 factor (ECF subfamily)
LRDKCLPIGLPGKEGHKMEDDLIRRAQNRDMQAFEELVHIYEKKVYNIALRMMSNADDAYDASQEVFIKIYNFLPTFKWESSFYTWVYRITVNKCIDMSRKNKRDRTISIDADDEDNRALDIPDEEMSPEKLYSQKEIMEYVLRGIELLSQEHKSVLILRDIKGLSYSEIADIVN